MEGAVRAAHHAALRRVACTPLRARRPGDLVARQRRDQLLGEAADHRHAVPVGHAVDPDHQPAGRQAAEVVVALDEHHLRARARRGDRGRGFRRARRPRPAPACAPRAACAPAGSTTSPSGTSWRRARGAPSNTSGLEELPAVLRERLHPRSVGAVPDSREARRGPVRSTTRTIDCTGSRHEPDRRGDPMTRTPPAPTGGHRPPRRAPRGGSPSRAVRRDRARRLRLARPGGPTQRGVSGTHLDAFMARVEADSKAGRLPGAVLARRARRPAAVRERGRRAGPGERPANGPRHDHLPHLLDDQADRVDRRDAARRGRPDALGDPVSQYLPNSRAMQVAVEKPGPDGRPAIVERVAAPREMTVQDLLRHTSGHLRALRRSAVKDEYAKADINPGCGSCRSTSPRWRAGSGRCRSRFAPGTTLDYSISTDVLGLVVERVSARSSTRSCSSASSGRSA